MHKRFGSLLIKGFSVTISLAPSSTAPLRQFLCGVHLRLHSPVASIDLSISHGQFCIHWYLTSTLPCIRLLLGANS